MNREKTLLINSQNLYLEIFFFYKYTSWAQTKTTFQNGIYLNFY